MIEFYSNDKRINGLEYEYTRKIFDMLKVGCEIEFETKGGIYYNDLYTDLKTNSSCELFGFNTDGVYEVTDDGSLENGCELKTNGRILNSPELFYSQYYKIWSKIKNNCRMKISPRAGLHQHVLTPTQDGSSSLEKPLNSLIWENFLILFKNYFAGITWLTSALYENNENFKSYKRYDGFCKWRHLYKYNLNTDVTTNTSLGYSNTLRTDERYNALNVNNMSHSENQIKILHFEVRLPDGFICPSQLVAQNFLWKAMLNLALEFSLFGELKDKYGNNNLTHIRRSEISKYMNNPSGSNYPDDIYRYSVLARNVNLDYFKNEAKELVELCKPFLNKGVYYILNKLCDKNISIMLEEGKTPEQIDNELKVELVNVKSFNADLLKLLSEGKLDMTTLERAVASANEHIQINSEEVQALINFIKKNKLDMGVFKNE